MNSIDQRFRKLAGLLSQHTSVLIQACDYIGMKIYIPIFRATKLESFDITGWRSLLLTLMTDLRFFFFFFKKTNPGYWLTVGKEAFGSFLPNGDCRRMLVEILGKADRRSKACLKHGNRFDLLHQRSI